MEPRNLKSILAAVESGDLPAGEALRQLQAMHYEDLGFARTDLTRERRCGLPEVIFCQGKTAPQVVRIARSLVEATGNMLATRASEEVSRALIEAFPDADHCAAARTVGLKGRSRPTPDGRIAVVCAGTSDIPVAEEARVTAEFLDNVVVSVYDVGIAALHRLVSRSDDIRAANVIIVVAGMEGALASVVGGLVSRPVIAVPTSVGYGASFNGLAPLLTMLNSCAAGISVVNIDNGFGAACCASLINRMGMDDDPEGDGAS